MDDIGANWVSFKGFSDAYSAAAQDILQTLDAASVTSTTISNQAKDLDALLLSSIGLSNSGFDLIAPHPRRHHRGHQRAGADHQPAAQVRPDLHCLLQGAKFALDNGAYRSIGGNGRSVVQDVGLLLGDDPYRTRSTCPRCGPRGPGGKPSCGSLPDVSKNFPVRYLVTDTGFGTGLDVRPNPGIGFPGWVNYFPVTKANPEPPRVRHLGPPAPGPIVPPGSPPYGAPWYGPDGTPLWPNVPPPPVPPAAPAAPAPQAPLAAEVPAPPPVPVP